jgi:oxalate decarboxylase
VEKSLGLLFVCLGSVPHIANAASNSAASAHPYLFQIGDAPPVQFDGGNLRGANGENWPTLAGQEGSVYVVNLEAGAMREPHWHPNAWELNYVIEGFAKWTMLGPQGKRDAFEAKQGDIVFAPRGFLHYFENEGPRPLKVIVVFNTSTTEPKDDIGIAASVSALPHDVLGAVLGVDSEISAKLAAKAVKPVVILRKPKPKP